MVSPKQGFTKVNFDAAFSQDSFIAGFGVLLRKDDGSFLYALTEPSLARSVMVVECMAAHIGLLKAHELGLSKIVIEGDYKCFLFYFIVSRMTVVYGL